MISVPKLTATVFFLALLPILGYARTPDEVFDKVKDSIFVVRTRDVHGKIKKQGSGVLISSGRVVTNYHVVKGGVSFQVGQGKQTFPATIYSYEEDKDICLLDANGIKANPVQIRKAASLKVGDTVFAVGAPPGVQLYLSEGVVGQLRGEPPPIIQSTAPIFPGSSGGGLFDAEGRLVGLTTAKLKDGQNHYIAVPAEWIIEIQSGRQKAIGGDSADEWENRSNKLIQMKDWQGLIDCGRKWTKREAESPKAWTCLGYAYFMLKRYNDSIEAFHQSLRISINPGENFEAFIWRHIAIAYAFSGNKTAALEANRELRRLDPAQADILLKTIKSR
jgi:hypothetical protein